MNSLFGCRKERKEEVKGNSVPSAVVEKAPKMKKVVKMFTAISQREGAGFIINRPIGSGQITDKESDPFLLLDELGPRQYKKGEFEGAPWHPHRGFDTVMYMKAGEGKHQDSMGNKGILRAGEVQWMTAGAGILHDEGRDHPGGLLHGFQMWVNLPAKHKMVAPGYQQLGRDNFKFFEVMPGVRGKVIAGRLGGYESKLTPITPITYIDFNLDAGASYDYIIPAESDTTIVYIYEGKGRVCTKRAERKSTFLLSDKGNSVKFEAETALGLVLLSGTKIREPIERYGPFVMNTKKEIRKCLEDYRNGKLATIKGKAVVY